MKGLLISVDGIDGCGKTTIVSMLANHLRSHHKLLTFEAREPGSTRIGDLWRKMMFEDPTTNEMSPGTIDLGLAMSHNELVDKCIIPNISAGISVIVDRWFPDTNRCYQLVRPETPIWSIQLRSLFENPHPDISILLMIDPELGLSRAKKRDVSKFDSKMWSKVESMTRVQSAMFHYYNSLTDRKVHLVSVHENMTPENVFSAIIETLDPNILDWELRCKSCENLRSCNKSSEHTV